MRNNPFHVLNLTYVLIVLILTMHPVRPPASADAMTDDRVCCGSAYSLQRKKIFQAASVVDCRCSFHVIYQIMIHRDFFDETIVNYVSHFIHDFA